MRLLGSVAGVSISIAVSLGTSSCSGGKGHSPGSPGAGGGAGTVGVAGTSGAAGAAGTTGSAGVSAGAAGTAGTTGSAGASAGAAGAAGGPDGGVKVPGPACAAASNAQPNAMLAGLADNTAIDLGAFTCTTPQGDGNSCTRVTDYSGMVFDCKGHRLLMFGGGHATTYTDTVFSFDFATLKWTELYAPTPCTAAVMNLANYNRPDTMWTAGPAGPYPRPLSRHTYDLNAYIDTLDEFLLLLGPNGDSTTCPPGSTSYTYANVEGHVSHFDLAKGTWSASAVTAGNGRLANDYPASEVDPVTKKVLIVGRGGLFVYDPVARTRQIAIDNYNANVFGTDPGYANHLTYFPPNDRFYYFERGKGVRELIVNRQDFSKSSFLPFAVTGTAPTHGEPGYDYDSKNQIIGGAVDSGQFHVFDPVAKTWQTLTMQGATGQTQSFHALSYDPVNNVFVFVADSRHTYAYRYKN
jgi:hypothetical protein